MASPEINPIPNLFAEEDARLVSGRPTEGRSWDNTLAFLAELTAPVGDLTQGEVVDPKDYFPPIKQRTGLAKEKYYIRLEIASRYASEYNESLDQVAKRFGLTSRERVRKIFKDTLTALWESAQDELKQKYPLESLDTDKQNSLNHASRGEVVRALESGESVAEVGKRLGVGRVNDARRTSRRFGLEIPYLQRPVLERFAGLRNPDSKERQIQELLDQVKNLKQYVILLKAGLVINLWRVARSAGLYPDNSDIFSIYSKLREEELPARRLQKKIKGKSGKEYLTHYNFIAAIHSARAVDILRGASEFAHLKQNPVTQVAGPASRIPNTNELYWSGNYGRVGNLISEIRSIKIGSTSKVKLSDIISNSPVPVYAYKKRGLYYDTYQKEELRAYLVPCLKELGLMSRV